MTADEMWSIGLAVFSALCAGGILMAAAETWIDDRKWTGVEE